MKEKIPLLVARAKIPLLVAMVLKVIMTLLDVAALVPGLGFLRNVVSFLNFASGVALIIYFIAEMFLLSPVGMALMCILVGIIFFFLPYVVMLILGMFIDSLFLIAVAGIICYALSGIVLTFVGGLLSSIEIVVVSGPFYIAAGIGAGVIGAGGAAAYGTNAAIDKAREIAVRRKRQALSVFLGNLLVLLVIVWPVLSATNAVSGILACKPAVIASEAFLNHINLPGSNKISDEYKALFDEKNWAFGNNFYSSYINNGNNNIVQGEKDMIAGNEKSLAVLLDGLLYVQEDTVTDMYNGAGYMPRKTDALVLVGSKAFIFGYNKVFVCGSDGQYTWKKTKWTSEFENLSKEDQFERVYEILEHQNTREELKFSYDEVGTVAYAQRNGLLLGYDDESHMAIFALKGKDGNVTVYRQLKPGEREELGSFTPTYISESGLPYYADMNEKALVYLDGKQVKSLFWDNWVDYTMFTHPEWDGEDASLTSIHYGDLGEEGQYYVYLDDQQRIWLDTRLIGIVKVDGEEWNVETTRISGFAGDYIYSIQYNDSLLSKLTYLEDYNSEMNSDTSGWGLTSIWMEDWSYQRIPMKRSNFDSEVAEQERLAKEAEEEARLNDPLVKYPAPEIASRNDRERYDKTYIAASKYSTYVGPQDYFWFQYPTRFYDHVDYTLENDGVDITIVFTCDDDSSYLEVSVHPLPEDAEDIKSYAEAWCDSETASLYNGLVNNFEEYDGEYRFRLQGWTKKDSGVETHVICRVDQENIMKMVLRFPNGTNKDDSAVKEFYHKYMNYRCGFGIPTKAPKIK